MRDRAFDLALEVALESGVFAEADVDCATDDVAVAGSADHRLGAMFDWFAKRLTGGASGTPNHIVAGCGGAHVLAGTIFAPGSINQSNDGVRGMA